jgi:hypothetical protein
VLTHDWASTGIAGWSQFNYGTTGDAGRWWVEADNRLWQRTNHGTDHTGGTNCARMWQGSHFIAMRWGRMYDFQLEVTVNMVDNDGVGVLARWHDADNFLLFVSNNE